MTVNVRFPPRDRIYIVAIAFIQIISAQSGKDTKEMHRGPSLRLYARCRFELPLTRDTMATNNPRQPKRSWKDDKPAGGRPGQRGWRAEKADAGAARGPILTRRGKIILAVSGLTIGAVIVLAIVLLSSQACELGASLRPRGRTGYQTNLAQPENVLGVRGLDAVQSWTESYNNAAKGPGSKVDVRRATLTAGDDPLVETIRN